MRLVNIWVKNIKEEKYKIEDVPSFMREDVIVALRAERFYKDTALTVEEFNALFTKAPNEITATIAPLGASFKNAIRTKAKRMIEDREIDSIAIKEAIEAGLGSPLFDDYN